VSVQSIAKSGAVRLTQLATTASRRPWAYLWVPLPLSWQLSVRAMGANSLEEGLAVLLTIPELIGFACVVAMIAWQLWQIGKTIAARFAHRPFRPQVYPWFARIGLWFCVGFVLAGFVAR